jgi:integrase
MGFGEEPLEGRLSVAPFAPVVRRRTPPPADRRWTVGELVPLYAAEALSTHRGGGSELRSLLRVTQPLADRECSDVNAEDLVPILEAVAVLAPVHANRMRAYYSAFCTWALEQDYTGYNPVVDVARLVDEAPRERTLSLSELVEIWQAAEELGRPFGPAIQLLILTAARRQDVAGMRRADLQPGDNGHLNWMVVMHKRGGSRPFMIPLSPLAQGIVERACRLSPPGSALVFTTTGSTPISGWSHAKRDLDEIICSRRSRAAVETQPEFSEWRFNDLRGSFVAVSERHLDGDSDILNRCLDRLTEVKGLIPRLLAQIDDQFELRRDALFAWAKLLESAVG